MAEEVAYLKERRDQLVMVLGNESRRKRQEASHELAAMARENPEVVSEIAESLIGALELPEAQTRWECLDALSEVALVRPECVTDAFDGAEEALFDDGSASARLAAFRFLCRFGSRDAESSRRAWPLMCESIQCYHGDPEYRDMLICLLEFAQGAIAPEVGDALVGRMSFDAKNGSGYARAYSTEICAVLERD